jgi:hypothetical protein
MSTVEDVFYLYERNSSLYHTCSNISSCPQSWNNECLCYLTQPVKPNTIGDQTVPHSITRKMYIVPNQECPICIEPIVRKKDAYLTCCGHGFHKKCIYKSYETKMHKKYASQYRCPLCRTRLGNDLDNLNDRYTIAGNALDDLDNFWIKKEFMLPQMCSGGWNHYIGIHPNCNICLQYIQFGNN